MAHNLLIATINGKIQLNKLLEWLTSDNTEDFPHILDYNCTRREFISYFLNFVHDETSCFDPNETQKTVTPSLIKNDNINQRCFQKRRSLFLEDENSPNKCHDLPTSPKSRGNCTNFTSPKSQREITNMTPNANPIYSKNVFHTPRSKVQKSAEKGLCLGDFIVRKSSTKKKVQKTLTNDAPTRRIKPTNLNQRLSGETFCKSQNSFNFHQDFVELPLNDSNDERNILAGERLKIDFKPVENVKLHITRLEIVPDVNLVSDRNVLDLFVDVYSCLLNHNLVLNVTSELYFLMSLLVMKRYDTSIKDVSIELQNLFKNFHNCVYFAVEALNKQLNVLRMFDRLTIKFFVENDRIKQFCGDISNRFNCENINQDEIVETVRDNVCFISETDNRENFPNEASFHAFRKQRDLFYEILRIWEHNHLIEGWSFSTALGGKIRSLLNLHNDSVNFLHFARLFKMQLLTTCHKHNGEEGVTSENQTFLSSLPNVDADKLQRLKTRIVTKHDCNGINSTPTFTGHQEFYKEFILASWTHVFYKHLEDSLIFEINQVNNVKFIDDVEHSDTFVDASTRNSFLEALKSCRLLGKFLGFMESIPYKTNHQSEKILTSQIETRNSFQPNFDLKGIIYNSIRNKRLILTIPWATKYLSMLDHVTLRLPYFTDVIRMLFNIYNKLPRDATFRNATVVKLCLGWLFELPHFPRESIDSASYSIEIAKQMNLDDLDIIDRKILYVCCPYLDEFKKLLSANSTSGRTLIKHITPTSALESPNLSSKKLKAQLEEEFFNGQPISVRKTVEFISERVASSCVKYICNCIVPDCKNNSLDEFRKISCFDDDGSLQILKNKSNELAVQSLTNLLELCTKYSMQTSKERIPTCVELLLSHEELRQVKDTCIVIAMRMCNDRVQQWVNSHVNLNVFVKEFDLEINRICNPSKDKKPTFLLPPGGRPIKHNPDALSALKIIDKIRAMCLYILEKKPVPLHDIEDILINARRSIDERCDFNDSILHAVNKLLIDFLLLILTQHFNIGSTLLNFIAHWKDYKTNEDLFKTIVCSRNVMLLAQSLDVEKSWNVYAEFTALLLKNKLLSCQDFETQCVAMYKAEWDEVTLRRLLRFFRGVVEDFVASGGSERHFVQLLSFIPGFCSNLDF